MRLHHNVFVSSTFQDMHFERDLLHGVVIPELISRFSKKKISIDLVDLRWGIDVSDNASESESSTKILKVCFDEIERSKPFFVGFIGERYGWIPNLSKIEKKYLDSSFENFKGDISVTEMEMLYALEKFDSSDSCLFFIRNGLKADDIKDEKIRKIYFPTDTPDVRCTQLKALLREKYQNNTFDYSCYWDNDANTLKGLEGLCELMIEKLSLLIEQHVGINNVEDDTTLSNEKSIQQSVIDDIASRTFGREKEIKGLIDFVDNSSKKELIVSGVSGLGKSSLMAIFCEKYQKEAIVIPFFAGISMQSKSFTFLPRYIYSILENDFREEILLFKHEEVKKLLIAALSKVSRDKKVVIVVDALDQFIPCKSLYEMDWVNEQLLPENVKIIYSAVPEFLSHVKKRDMEIYNLDCLSDSDIKLVASGVALKLHKELGEEALNALLNKRDTYGVKVCNNPLYLILLIEMLCSFDHDDFSEINVLQEKYNLTPSAAIQAYLAKSIDTAGENISVLLADICKKSIRQLGKKYDIITSLLTSKRKGMSEREIIGITAYADNPINTVDFSLYRRMFRVHLTQKDDGNWCFSHAKIQREQEKYVEGVDKAALYESAEKYYSSLADEDENKYAGCILFYAKQKKYRELLPFALKNVANEETLEVLIECGAEPILEVCSEQEAVSLCEIALNQAKLFSDAKEEELLDLFVKFINKIQQYDINSHILLLSELYSYLGLLLYEIKDPRGETFCEIGLNILLKGKIDREVCVDKALYFCGYFEALEKLSLAERCAKIAVDCAKGHNDEKLYAKACLKLYQVIEKNPLSLRKVVKGRYLASAMETAIKNDDKELALLCAIEYKKLGRIFKKSSINAIASNIIENTLDNFLSPIAIIKKYLYLGQEKNDIALFRKAYKEVISVFAESSSLDHAILYQEVLEKYLYYLMAKREDEKTASQILQRLDGAYNKLYMMTGDIMFVDKRVITLKDYENCFGERGLFGLAKEQSQNYINNELKSRKKTSSRKKDVYLHFALKILLATIIVVTFIELIMFLVTFSEIEKIYSANVIYATLSGLSDLLQSILIVFISVAIFFFLQLLFAPSKDTFDYKVDKKIFKINLLLIVAVYVGLFFVSTITTANAFDNPITAFRVKQGIIFLTSVFASSLTYFLAYGLNILIRKPFAKDNVRKVRYLYSGKQLILKHIALLTFTLLSFLVFVNMWNYSPKVNVGESLDYFGTTPSAYAKISYLPFVIQLALSFIELIFLRKNFGKTTSKGRVQNIKKEERSIVKLLVQSTAIALASVIFAILLLACGQEVAIKTFLAKKDKGYASGYAYEVEVYEGSQQLNIVYYYGYKEKIIIPKTLDGYCVYGIESFNTNRIEMLIISEGVCNISAKAFAGANKLTKITLPKSIVYVGREAFADCTSLVEIFFTGTVEEFNGITKGEDWATGIVATSVKCIDGNVDIE